MVSHIQRDRKISRYGAYPLYILLLLLHLRLWLWMLIRIRVLMPVKIVDLDTIDIR